MFEVEDYIYQLEENQQSIMLFMHHWLVEMGLLPKIKYRIPFYYGKTWICYMNPIKRKGIELVFVRGRELSNTQGILQSKGRKMVLGIHLDKPEDVPMEALQEIFEEAMVLDETVPYTFKKKK